jgi:hypothetical protein
MLQLLTVIDRNPAAVITALHPEALPKTVARTELDFAARQSAISEPGKPRL